MVSTQPPQCFSYFIHQSSVFIWNCIYQCCHGTLGFSCFLTGPVFPSSIPVATPQWKGLLGENQFKMLPRHRVGSLHPEIASQLVSSSDLLLKHNHFDPKTAARTFLYVTFTFESTDNSSLIPLDAFLKKMISCLLLLQLRILLAISFLVLYQTGVSLLQTYTLTPVKHQHLHVLVRMNPPQYRL